MCGDFFPFRLVLFISSPNDNTNDAILWKNCRSERLGRLCLHLGFSPLSYQVMMYLGQLDTTFNLRIS